MILLHAVSDIAQRAIRAMTMSFIAVVFMLVGVGFLTSALWMVLEAWQDALFAAQVLGFGYLALGLLLYGIVQIAMKSPSRRRPPHRLGDTATRSAGSKDPIVTVIEGFLMGLDAGRRSARPDK